MRCLVVAIALLGLSAATASAAPPQGYQSDSAFASSYAGHGVSSTAATEQQTSCYTPELAYFGALTTLGGYPDGGMSPCNGSATTGEDLGPYATQNLTTANPMRVKDHSESDIRVDPTDSNHVIGQSKWFVSAEGYNHLLGFYESQDGGQTWPVQGHVPGYEGWTDNTDPVGAFDPWGNFYSLVLGYQFYYSKSGGDAFKKRPEPTKPPGPPPPPPGAGGANG